MAMYKNILSETDTMKSNIEYDHWAIDRCWMLEFWWSYFRLPFVVHSLQLAYAQLKMYENISNENDLKKAFKEFVLTFFHLDLPNIERYARTNCLYCFCNVQ